MKSVENLLAFAYSKLVQSKYFTERKLPMRIIAQSVFFFVCAFALIGYAQDKTSKQEPTKPAAAPTPTPDPLTLTDAEKREVTPMLQEDQALAFEKNEAEQKLLTVPNGDAAGFEARGRELKDILTRRGAWQQKFQGWLQAVRQRANCLDCRADFQAGRLVKPTPAQ
jgi:hypothetical protein